MRVPRKSSMESGNSSNCRGETESATNSNNAKGKGPCDVTLEDFEELQILHEGRYWNLYLVRKRGGRDNGTLYAMRRVQVAITQKKEIFRRFLRERHLGAKVNFVHASSFVRLRYFFQTELHYYSVMDYLEGGDLRHLLRKRKSFTVDEVRFYIAELVLAIESLHEMGVALHSIQLYKILLDSVGHIVIADYGSSEDHFPHRKDERAFSVFQTKPYMGTRVIKHIIKSLAEDWWHLGVVMCEMLTGYYYFCKNDREYRHKEDVSKYIRRIVQGIAEEKGFSSDIPDFITRLVKLNHKERLGGGEEGVLEIKRHPFFSGINWTDMAQKAVAPPFRPSDVGCDRSFKIPELPAWRQNWWRGRRVRPLKCNIALPTAEPGSSAPGASPSEPKTSNNTLNTESSVSISHKRKQDSALKRHCPVKPSSNMTLLKITQKMDAFERRPLKRRYSSKEAKTESSETLQSRRCCVKRRRTV